MSTACRSPADTMRADRANNGTQLGRARHQGFGRHLVRACERAYNGAAHLDAREGVRQRGSPGTKLAFYCGQIWAFAAGRGAVLGYGSSN